MARMGSSDRIAGTCLHVDKQYEQTRSLRQTSACLGPDLISADGDQSFKRHGCVPQAVAKNLNRQPLTTTASFCAELIYLSAHTKEILKISPLRAEFDH